MIASLINLVIIVLVCGLLIAVLFWVVENFFAVPIPMVAKQVVGVIALLLIALYLLRIFGVA